VWDNLEEMAGGRIEQWLQILLGEEITTFLGRRKSGRIGVIRGSRVERNG